MPRLVDPSYVLSDVLLHNGRILFVYLLSYVVHSGGSGYPITRLPEGTRPFFSYPEPTFEIYLLPGTDPDPSSLPGGYPKGN